MVLVDLSVKAAKEFDGLQVFSAAEWIRNPLPFLSRIVEVKHRSHRIHAQPVDMVGIQPECGRTEQKAANFMTPVVEDVTVPVFVKSLARTGMLVKVCSVEKAKSPVIVGEM